MLGQWKNFEELEENLTIEELNAILNAAAKKEMSERHFAAALKGIKLDNPEDEDPDSPEAIFNRVVAEAKAEASGKTTEQVEFDELELGFAIETEEEE